MTQQNTKPQNSTEKAAILKKALALHGQMNLAEAEELYRNLLSDNDNENHTILYRLGIVCLQTNRHQEAIDFLVRAQKINPGSTDVMNNLGTAYLHSGQTEQAKATYEQALLINPNHPYILNNLGTLVKNDKDRERAEMLFQKALCFKSDYVEAHNNLGMLYSDMGRLEEAAAKFREAIRHNPEWASAYNNLGNALKDQGLRDDAAECYRKAIEYDPEYSDAYNNLGNMLRSNVEIEEAKKCFKKALEINPDNNTAFYNLMMLMEFTHNLDEAENLLEELKKKNPGHQAVTLLSGRLARRKGNIEEGIKVIEERGIKDGQLGMYTYFELGQLHDRAGHPAEAFAAFTKGNNLHAQSNEARYVDRMTYPNIIETYKAIFTEDWVKSWSPAPKESKYPTPVFIVGFPRSGTTLLDQILYSHPDFFVVEEKPAIEKVRYELHLKYGNYAESLADLPEEEIENMRKIFYDAHSEYNDWDGKGYFVDKFPMNTVLSGVIHRIFPDAKFIFALRHPCDCVLSCFMQQFTINPGMIHFLGLESGAKFYDEVMNLWIHMQEVMPLNVYTHRYEDVVDDFQTNIANLLKFLEVPWDDAVLEYDKTAKKREKLANTPSYAQVTEKIYTRARYRWEGYREQMKPVLDTLLPYAKKFGYNTDE